MRVRTAVPPRACGGVPGWLALGINAVTRRKTRSPDRTADELAVVLHGDLETVIVERGRVKTGVPVRTDNPKEVGSDRIMNSLAAVHLYGGPAIGVDFGTFTNFDAASALGEFVGGALAPGIEISMNALSRRAA